jgi:hypothetical protein
MAMLGQIGTTAIQMALGAGNRNGLMPNALQITSQPTSMERVERRTGRFRRTHAAVLVST